jgi:serine-type D-Ala-D-Ala carboxypeptidase/endopeptidase
VDVEPIVTELLARHARRHVGVAVGVIRGDETWTTGRSADARTIFEIGSVTKVFTATVLAAMVEDGVLRLDEPVQRYLPPGVELPVRGRPITLSDLATHTAGLPSRPRGLLRRALRNRRNPWASFSVADLYAGLPSTRVREPGRRLRYSNLGSGLLGHVLTARAGCDYEELVVRWICRPLGLEDTRVSVPEAALERFAQGHDRRGRPVPHWDLPALAGAGALRSTVADMLRFLRLHLGEGEPALTRAAALTHPPRVRRGRTAIGLGWFRFPLRGSGHEALIHNGGTGGFRTFAGFVPATRTAVVALASSARSVDRLGFQILERMQPVRESPGSGRAPTA